MLVVGLTGNFGSGKSTVARMLSDLGAMVLDADVVGHEMLVSGSEVWREVVDLFGREVLSEDNSVDRKKLAGLVFSNPEARERLNRIMHPRMREAVSRKLDLWRREGIGVAVLEATLLIEAGWIGLVDEVWVVVAPETEVVERVGKGGAFSSAQVAPRWRNQMSPAEKAEYADVLIDNSGSMAELRDRVRMVWEARVHAGNEGVSGAQ